MKKFLKSNPIAYHHYGKQTKGSVKKVNVIELSTIKKMDEYRKRKRVAQEKTHAELLKEAFIALEKYNISQMYKNL